MRVPAGGPTLRPPYAERLGTRAGTELRTLGQTTNASGP